MPGWEWEAGPEAAHVIRQEQSVYQPAKEQDVVVTTWVRLTPTIGQRILTAVSFGCGLTGEVKYDTVVVYDWFVNMCKICNYVHKEWFIYNIINLSLLP